MGVWSELKAVNVVYARSDRLTVVRSGELEHLAVTLVGCSALIVAKSNSSIWSTTAMPRLTLGRREYQYDPIVTLKEMCDIRVIYGSNTVYGWNIYVSDFNISVLRLYGYEHHLNEIMWIGGRWCIRHFIFDVTLEDES